MARRSLRDLFRKTRTDKKALSPEMRTLLDSFEAQYGVKRDPNDARRSSDEAAHRPARS